MITYFKDKNNKSKKNCKKYKTITTILKSFHTIAIIARTSSSITLSVTGIGLIAIPISTATACGLSITNKVLYEIVMQKYNKYKKLYEKINKQLNLLRNYIAKVYRIIWLTKVNMKVYVTFLLNILMKQKMNLFHKHEYQKKIIFFSNNKLKFQPRN